MAKHEDLYPLILPEVPGCPIPTVRMAINRAARELCTQGLAWREDAYNVYLRPDAFEYDMDADCGAEVVVLNSAKIDGRPLSLMTDPRALVSWGSRTGGVQRVAVSPDALRVWVDPMPSDKQVMTLNVALRPSLRATTLPEVIVRRYEEALASGAKWFLMRMPRQTWTDGAAATVAKGEFDMKVGEARVEAETGNVTGSLRVTPRAFGRR